MHRIADQKQNGLDDDDNKINGDNNKYTESPNKTDHSILSFFEEVSKLTEGTYKLINGQWVKQ